MQPRLILFIDADDNTMLARLADDRLQLSAVDSRPTLEGYELKRFLAELFQTYAAAPLIARATAAAAALDRARAQLPAGRTPRARAARAALDEARQAVAALREDLSRPPPPERDVAAGAARRKHRRQPNRVADPGPRPAMYQRPRWLPAQVTLADLLAIRRGEPMPSAQAPPPPP